MKSVVNGLKFVLKYAVILFAIAEIIEFAIKKLENIDLSSLKKKQNESSD